MKTIKTFILTLIFLGGMSAFAQTSPLTPAKSQSKTAQQENFTDAELMEFAAVKMKVKEFSAKVEIEKNKKIESAGMSLEDYKKIEEADNPNVQMSGVSKETQLKKQNIDRSMEKLDRQLEKITADVASNTKIGLEGYKKIEQAMAHDKNLAQKIKKLSEKLQK